MDIKKTKDFQRGVKCRQPLWGFLGQVISLILRDKYCRSLASDVYSLGITFSQLFSGNLSEISESMKENNSEFLPLLN